MSLALIFIQAARRLLTRAHEEIPAEHGVSLADTALLLSVYAKPGSTVKEIASSLSRDKTTVSRSISNLSKYGLLRGELDSLDGRRKNLFLTKKGQHVILPALDSLEEDLEAVTGTLDASGIDVLSQVSSLLSRL
jgi:DNA-binding MarR family transcriptional regulator